MSWLETFSSLLEQRIGFSMGPSIVERVGFVFEARTKQLGLMGVDRYVEFLASDDGEQEFWELANVITIHKTDFFRYPEVIDTIISQVVPSLHRLIPPDQPLNIWSAGCATGEEPYSLAMALDRGGWFTRREIHLRATDVNLGVLARAEAGTYSPRQMRKVPEWAKAFFVQRGHSLQLVEKVRRRVGFLHHNLADPDYPAIGGWHIVVCANVLIYFTPAMIETIFQRFYRVMAPNSVLLLGGGEPVMGFRTSFTVIEMGGTWAQAKGQWWEGKVRVSRIPGQLELAPAAVCEPEPVSTPQGVGPTGPTTRAADPSDDRRPALASSPRKVPASLAKAASSDAQAPVDSATRLGDARPAAVQVADDPGSRKGINTVADGAEIEKSLLAARDRNQRGDRTAALELLEDLYEKHEDEAAVCCAYAFMLLRANRFGDACEALGGAVAADPLAFDLHYFQGWALRSSGRLPDALEALRRSLFLEPHFALARYEFATALHATGDLADAIREYAKAETAARDTDTWSRLRALASDALEPLWIDAGYIVALAEANRARASDCLPPIGRSGDQELKPDRPEVSPGG